MGLHNAWILVIFLTLTCACHGLVCNAGQEVQRSNGSLTCETCSPGWYQPLPNVTEGVKCSKKFCPSEAGITNYSDPTKDAVCVCNTTLGYYGENHQNCRYKQCPTNSTLTQTGVCVPEGPTSVGTTPGGTTPGGTTPVGTTDVPDNQVTQSQRLYALFALLIVPVGAAAVVVYRCKKKHYEPVNRNQTNGVQQSHSTQDTSCV